MSWLHIVYVANLSYRTLTMDPRERRELSVADLLPIAQGGAMRSKLGRWFITNRVEFARMLDTYRPRWEGLVEKFGAEGLIVLPENWDDPEVRARVVNAARQAWHRVKLAPPRQPDPPGAQVRAAEPPPQQATPQPAGPRPRRQFPMSSPPKQDP